MPPKGYVSPEYLRLVADLVAETKIRSYGLMRLRPVTRCWMLVVGPVPLQSPWLNGSAHREKSLG